MNAREAIRELARPRPEGEPIKRAIERAAKAWGGEYWRTFDIWYGKARRIEPHEANAIADAVQAKRELEAANELHELRLRLTRLEARLGTTDEDFYRPDIDFSRDMVRGAR